MNSKMGGPAFAGQWMDFQPETGNQVVRDQWCGMTLWDFFAAHALNGLLASDGKIKPFDEGNPYAYIAAKIADAMIAERAKRMEEL